MIPILMFFRSRHVGRRVIASIPLILFTCSNGFGVPLGWAREVAQLRDANSSTTDPHSNASLSPTRALDSHSCLTCHDGSVASNMLNKVCNISSRFSDRWSNEPLGQRLSHPIGVNYLVARQFRPGARLKDIALLPSVVRLENGATGCLSCHDPASSRPYKLVMDNAESRLCFACHDL